MKIAIGADHRGFEHKEFIKKHVAQVGAQRYTWIDVGAFDEVRSDYPIFADLVAHKVASHEVDRGVLLCGSGIGMAVVANRYPGIYAGVVWNEKIAHMSREHDKVNVLVMPSDFVTPELAVAMVTRWLEAEFLGGRYQERIDMIDSIATHTGK